MLDHVISYISSTVLITGLLSHALYLKAFSKPPPQQHSPPQPHSENTKHNHKHHHAHLKEYHAATDDGFLLTLERIVFDTDKANEKKQPILLLHGLFQSSGVFTSNGNHASLAFYLADHGYDVWLGNNRCVTTSKHWDWSLDELANYDFPCLINKVLSHSTYDSLIFIGHSQGNAQGFLGLTPDLCGKIKLFIALAPAVYLGDLLLEPPVSLLMNCPENVYNTLFGKEEFLSIMNLVQKKLPEKMFAELAYSMFNYLFGWCDENWDKRNKPIYFQSTPRPTSSRAIYHWARMAKHKVICHYSNSITGAIPSLHLPTHKLHEEQKAFPVDRIQCPLAVFYGGKDEIINGKLFIDHVKSNEGVELVYEEVIEEYEHLDLLWARDIEERVFEKILKIL